MDHQVSRVFGIACRACHPRAVTLVLVSLPLVLVQLPY